MNGVNITEEQFKEIMIKAGQTFGDEINYCSVLNLIHLCLRYIADNEYKGNPTLHEWYMSKADVIFEELEKLGYYSQYH